MTQKAAITKGFDIKGLLDGSNTHKLIYADIEFTVRLLSIGDQEEVKKQCKLPGGNRKAQKYDDEKLVTGLAIKAIESWKHVDGDPILNDGKVFEVTPENVKKLLDMAAGLANYIVPKVCNAHKMYSTLDEEDIKN